MVAMAIPLVMGMVSTAVSSFAATNQTMRNIKDIGLKSAMDETRQVQGLTNDVKRAMEGKQYG